MDASRRSLTRHRLAGALLAGALLAAGASPARAQYVYDDELMRPREVAWRLAERGFSGLSRPYFDGRSYVVEAFAPNGARVRLFVDARDGAVVGRQRLDAPVYAPPPARVVRSAPGYGWTEEEVDLGQPRRGERLVPPADIPYPGAARVAPPRAEPSVRRADLPARPSPVEANPLGVNPDAQPRNASPRKAAKAAAPAKPAQPRLTPEAPGPSLKPGEPATAGAKTEPPAAIAARPDQPKVEAPKLDQTKADSPKADLPKSDLPKSDAAKSDAAKSDPAAAEQKSEPKSAALPTPASVQPPPSETAKAGDAKAADSWKDPPADRKPVRVIGGATVVPGTDGKPDAPRSE